MSKIKIWAGVMIAAMIGTVVVITVMDSVAKANTSTKLATAEQRVSSAATATAASIPLPVRVDPPAGSGTGRGEPAKRERGASKVPSDKPGKITPQDLRDFMHVEIQKQPVDAAWAKETKVRAKEMLSAFASDHSVIQSIDCRSSACEVVIAHDTEADFFEFAEKAFQGRKFLWQGEWSATRMEKPASGKDQMVVYLSREGTPLPSLDPGAQ